MPDVGLGPGPLAMRALCDLDPAELAAAANAEAEPDSAARAVAKLLASGGDGTDPARGFPEWEKDVLAARLGISTGQAKRFCRTAVALRERLPAAAHALASGATALRRRLDARDQHCRFPTCTRPARRCHAHVLWWEAGGETTESNLINPKNAPMAAVALALCGVDVRSADARRACRGRTDCVHHRADW